MNAPVLQWSDTHYKDIFCQQQDSKPWIFHHWPLSLVLLTCWLISELTGPWMSCLKGCDSLAKATGWGGAGEVSVSKSPPYGWKPLVCKTPYWKVLQEQQWHKLFKEFYCKKTRESTRSPHSRDACFPGAACCSSQSVIFQRYSMYANLLAIRGQMQQQRRDDMLDMCQPESLNQNTSVKVVLPI